MTIDRVVVDGTGSPISIVLQEMGAISRGELDSKADKANVLALDNTASFTPDADYEPATKKYVDDLVGANNGTAYLIPGTAAENATNFMAASDDPSIKVIHLLGGTYTFETDIFVYGTKDVVCEPGVILSINADLNAITPANGYGALVRFGTEGFGGPTNNWTGTWTGGKVTLTANALTEFMFFVHGCLDAAIKKVRFEYLSADSSEAIVDAVESPISTGDNSDYQTGGVYGTRKNLTYEDNWVLCDQVGGGSEGGTGFRATHVENIVMKGNHIEGVGDDCYDCVGCNGVKIIHNFCSASDSRIIVSGCQNFLIADNTLKRQPDRNGDFAFNAFIASGIFYCYGTWDLEGEKYNRNGLIKDNVMEIIEGTASSHITVQLSGGNQNVTVEDNIAYNFEPSIQNFIKLSDENTCIQAPGIPIEYRMPRNITIKDNKIINDPSNPWNGSNGRTRIILKGMTPDSTQTVQISGTPTGGTYTLRYDVPNYIVGVSGSTGSIHSSYTTAPIAYNADSATVQAALRALVDSGDGYYERQGVRLDAVTVTTLAGSAPDITHEITFVEVSRELSGATRLPVPDLVCDITNLTGGTPAQTVTDTTTTTLLDCGVEVDLIDNTCYEIAGTSSTEPDPGTGLRIRGNRVGSNGGGVRTLSKEFVVDASESLRFGLDDVLFTSSASSNSMILPKIVMGMAPITGTVGANGFRIRTVTQTALGETINGVQADSASAYAIIPANSSITCTPTSVSAWLIEVVDSTGTRAPATMVP